MMSPFCNKSSAEKMPRNLAATALIIIFVIIPFFSGCAPVGPNYQKPEIKIPDAWHEAISKEMARQPGATLQTWWRIFDDPVLNDLIEQARQSNLDIKIALSGIAASRARLGVVSGKELPNANVFGSFSRFKHSDQGPFKQMAPPGGFEGQNMFMVGVDALWEVDVFGRIRRQIEAAGAEYEASIEDYRDVMVTLFAEVALVYVEIRSCQRRIQCAEANAAIQKKMLELTRARFHSGISSKLDTAQATSNLANTEAAVPPLTIRLNTMINRLAVLLDTNQETLQRKLGGSVSIPIAKENIGIGVPADLLRQRPDVRMAEKQLAAQTARIGVATADLYPRFTISGFFGLETGSFSDIGGGSSLAWGIRSPVKWNFFSGGKTRSNITFHKEIARQELLKYRDTVLKAMEEVRNAIVAHAQEKLRRNRLREAVEATREAVDLVIVQYETGLTNFNNVLDTQRSLFEQQDQLVVSEGDVVFNLIRLYKALGGGWALEKGDDVS
ncbi:efflux transporter, outer membrane factor lipoprotein, NodT family [delta proteobacterium NaphS2]|nr:efflux transporter, outer membrane factor lipoprotein, NodT family [delta proteobacterium NaphS2]